MLTLKGRQIFETLEETVDPKHTALVVHELLNDFCAKGGNFDKAGRRIDASAIVKPVANLLDAARKYKVRVIYVRYTMHTDYSTLSDFDFWRYRETMMKPGAPGPAVIDGTWGWEIIDEVKPQPGDIVLRKYRPDAFIGTTFDEILRWNGIKTFVIVGIGSEVGIVPTVIHAANLGYFCVAPSDCLRPTDPARAEDAMKFIRDWARVNPHTEVINAWKSRAK